MTPQQKQNLKRRKKIPEIINLPNEIWKRCPSYIGYLASNFARIKTVDLYKTDKNGRRVFIYGRLLAQNRPPSQIGTPIDYWRISVNQKRKYAHILICDAFHENPENKKEVNHKDGNKLNNLPSNLEWNTHLENVQHSLKTGLSKSIKRFQPLSSIALRKKIIDTKSGVVYNSITEAAYKNNINRRHLNNMLAGTKTNKTNFIYYDNRDTGILESI
jgi:hypothetical protein